MSPRAEQCCGELRPKRSSACVAAAQVIEIESSDYSKHVDEGGCCEQNCGKSDPNRIDRNPCTISIEVPKQMDPPIYMYYKLTNYYQNHRRYVKSRSDQQLVRGQTGWGGCKGHAPADA